MNFVDEFDLREKINEYFLQYIPNISPRNILKKTHKRDTETNKKRFFPSIIPTRSKFNIPKFGYNDHVCENMDNKPRFGPMTQKFKRDPNASQKNLKQTAFIEFTLNPSGDFIANNKNWAIELMRQFNQYTGNHFDPNKIKLGFFQSFKMFHIYMDLPKQVFYGQHWNAQVAEFIEDGLNRMKSTAFSHTDILALRQWGGRYRNRVSIYINGDLPNDLPKFFQWGLGHSIQIRVSYDDIGQTQKRAIELPKCWNCQALDHTWRKCPKIKKARAIYIQQVNSNINLSKDHKDHLIRTWRHKPDYCGKCGKTGHSHTVCYGSEYCRHCHTDTHGSD